MWTMDMNETAVMLHQKSFEFAVRVVKLARFLSDKKQDWVLVQQAQFEERPTAQRRRFNHLTI